MRKLVTAPLLAGMFFLLVLIFGCFGKDTKPGKLYYEPPARLIDDYTGMVEVQELNWAWSQPGFTLSNYQSLSITPVSNLTGVEDISVANRIDEALAAWFTQNGFRMSDSGQISCEGAIVALKLDRSFTEKKYVFREKAADLFLEMEFVIKEMPAQNTLCKIRHGVIAPQRDQLAGQILSGLLSYFESHK
jgi:hypothetical protein